MVGTKEEIAIRFRGVGLARLATRGERVRDSVVHQEFLPPAAARCLFWGKNIDIVDGPNLRVAHCRQVSRSRNRRGSIVLVSQRPYTGGEFGNVLVELICVVIKIVSFVVSVASARTFADRRRVYAREA